MRRGLSHSCAIADSGAARCETVVTLANDAPQGLPGYVAGDPYGRNHSYVDVFIPGRADLAGVSLNGETTTSFDEREDGHRAVGAYARIDPGDRAVFRVVYDLPATADGYALVATPQPLARDASVRVSLTAPDGWVLRGPNGSRGTTLSYSGPFTRTLRFTAAPDERAGLAALWVRLLRFWRSPVG
jgi:hypothetical protein